MLRRLVSPRLTAPQQFRCFTIADIKLASLLPTTSDEGKVKRSETPREEIANRVIAFDFHSYRYEANRVAASNTPELLAINQRALNFLTPLGIENLEQVSRSTAAALRELDRDILRLLRNNVKRANERLCRLWEWLDPHVKAFTERVDGINSTANAPKPYSAYMNWVQPVHSLGSGQRMLGRDRKKSLHAILDRVFPEDWAASENVNPINYVVGARWQGKSLMLTEVVAGANTSRGDNFGGVVISFGYDMLSDSDGLRRQQSQRFGHVLSTRCIVQSFLKATSHCTWTTSGVYLSFPYSTTTLRALIDVTAFTSFIVQLQHSKDRTST